MTSPEAAAASPSTGSGGGPTLGMVGLGRMGANMVRRLQSKGIATAGYDPTPDAVAGVVSDGAVGAASLEELVGALASPRIVWIMVPAAVVDTTVGQLAELLSEGDIVIDGGNSHYHDDIRRARELAERGLRYLDVGTSGGVFGLERGYCMMVGGEAGAVEVLRPVLDALSPGPDGVLRTPGLEGERTPAEQGWLHCGPAGAGHFVKMVHNGIEYGLMASYAEGLDVLRHANVGSTARLSDAENTPLRNPEHLQYDLDIGAICEVWRRGSVISSWLLDLTAAAFVEDPELSAFSGRVSDSGEGRWTIQAAIEAGAPTPVLATALFSRFTSRGEAEFSNQVLSAMRKQFGGHVEQKEIGSQQAGSGTTEP
jgi:6-phosphogluconate dehydrogenase